MPRTTPFNGRRTVRRVFAFVLLSVMPVSLPVTAEGHTRIVVAGGSITEIVYALGAQAHLVAVDSTSQYPEPATMLPGIGYLRALSAEPILAINPTLLLADSDAGPPAVLDQLRAAGTRVMLVPEAKSPEALMEKIRFVAYALDRTGSGERLVKELSDSLAAVNAVLADVERAPPVLFLLSVGRGAPLAAGRNTSAEAVIELAGGRNALTGFDDYKPASTEAIAASGAEFVLVTERTAELLGGVDALLARPELAATPAGRDGNLVVMDGLLLLGFGPRLAEAVGQLAGALHGFEFPLD